MATNGDYDNITFLSKEPSSDVVTASVENVTGNASEFIGLISDAPEAFCIPIVFSLIFIVGVLGNGTLIVTVLRNKEMRSTPNVFLVSLAVGDLLLILVSVPFTATIYTFNGWPYGLVICKFNDFLQMLSLGVSIFTLTALSGDRYMAIVHPMSRHKGSPTIRTFGIAIGIWGLSIILAVPEAVAAHLKYHNISGQILVTCNTNPAEWGEWYPMFHAKFQFWVYFVVPILVISTFYLLMARMLMLSSANMPGIGIDRGHAARQIEARKKVARVVLSFVVIFAVCWLPRHIYTMWYHFSPTEAEYTMFWHVFKMVGFCLAFINSCVNPMALYFLSKQFRSYYNRYLFCCIARRLKTPRAGPASYASETSPGQALYNFRSTSNTHPGHQTSTSMTMMTTQ